MEDGTNVSSWRKGGGKARSIQLELEKQEKKTRRKAVENSPTPRLIFLGSLSLLKASVTPVEEATKRGRAEMVS